MDTKIRRRVLVNFDDTAWPPDDEGAPPIIRIESGRGYVNYRVDVRAGAEHLPHVSRIQQVLDEASTANGEREIDFLARWLNVFVGPTRDITEDGDDEYLEVASLAWQKFVGVVDFNQQERRDTTCEFQYYLRGEVYWLQPQRLVHYGTISSEGLLTAGNDRFEWEDDFDDEFPVGGYYGEDWAVEAAATEFFAGLDYDVIHGEYNETLKEVRR